jgi:hypothetical protein
VISRDDPSALIVRSRPNVGDPIARRRDAPVGLDDNNRVPGLHETVQLRHQLRHVRRMQTRGGFALGKLTNARRTSGAIGEHFTYFLNISNNQGT